MHSEFTPQKLLQAANRIASFIHQTPVFTCSSLNHMSEAKLFFKCEHFQKGGAFKIRGATNAGLQLSPQQRQRGLATHSSGNHAQAVALIAKRLGVAAHIVMPENSTAVKVQAVAEYGGHIHFCKPTLQAREEKLAEILQQTGAAFIPPYNDERVIIGQSTVAQELFHTVTDLDMVIAPVGGGGLLSGTSLAAHFFSPHTRVYGAEPAGADDAWQSLRAGSIQPVGQPQTIADGLLATLGNITFAVIQKYSTGILVVSEEEIIHALRLIWERMKLVVEPSAAVALAAVLKNKSLFKKKRVGIILSGGNVDLTRLPFH
ncbi:MAG: serine/threonine dehydratase [Chitinophagales bacterium]|nr:MAG: serine/threonine dehydratase [Chitinophagales bacterium]